MTLAAMREMADQLSVGERLELAEHIWGSLPPFRQSLTLAEIEARIDDIESGRVQPLSSEEFEAKMVALENELLHKRSGQRG
jgi:putative addiction module component (TIGR02574 family)